MATPTPEQMLKSHNLRRTPVRLGVLEVLAGGKHPLDATEIIAKLPATIDRVTVYRTLNTFVSKKMIHRVRGEDRSWRYAAGEPTTTASAKHQHPHFVCDDCGEVECLDSAQIPGNFVKAMKIESDYRIDYSEVVLHGSCPKCHGK
jgi:Fur family ferric uptake transcriptional regulator